MKRFIRRDVHVAAGAEAIVTMKRHRRDAGFTLIEVLVAATVGTMVLGAALAMTMTAQRGYTTQQQGAAVQQEGRYALEWIAGVVRSAGANPYNVTTSSCPSNNTPFLTLRMDPDGDGLNNDIRIHADVNPANGLLGGLPGNCTEPNEDITVAHDPAALTITRRDMNRDPAPVAMTDPIFTSLEFTYLTVTRVPTTIVAQVAYVVISVTGRSRVRNPYTDDFTTFTLQTEVNLRAR